MLALERPSAARQLALLAAVVPAFATRPQFAALYVTWLARARARLVDPAGEQTAGASRLVRLWPSAVPLALAVVVLAAASSRAPPARVVRRVLGAVARLRPAPGGKWLVYHLADFELYLAVIPLAVAPIVLWHCSGDGRAGSDQRQRSPRSSSRSTPRCCSSSPRSTARRTATTGSTTGTSSTSSRSGSSCSSCGSPRASRVPRRDGDRRRRALVLPGVLPFR